MIDLHELKLIFLDGAYKFGLVTKIKRDGKLVYAPDLGRTKRFLLKNIAKESGLPENGMLHYFKENESVPEIFRVCFDFDDGMVYLIGELFDSSKRGRIVIVKN